MQSIGNIFRYNFISPHKEISEIAKQTQACALWSKVFGEFCPEHSEKSMPISLKGGVLAIAALDDATADAIHFCRERLMQELNIRLGRRMVWWISCER